MRILGIDPGYATIGFGILDAERGNSRLLQYGTITTSPELEFPQRLNVIYEDMNRLLDAVKPDVMAIEELFWGHNVTTGIGVSHGRGVILLTAAQRELPIVEYTPMQIKQAVVGYGNATKLHVMDMTKRYKAVFFDLGGTLRIALMDEPYMKHARRKMAEIAGAEMPYEEF